jgi:hypothetical protein
MGLLGVEPDVLEKPTRPTVFANRRCLSPEEIDEGKTLIDDYNPWERPHTRADCINGPRPCPYVGCRYHLYLYPTGRGETSNIKLNHPDKDVWDLFPSCALDVADGGYVRTLDEIGGYLNVTRERVRQIEATALRKLRQALYLGHDPRLKDVLVLWEFFEEWRAAREPFDESIYWGES